MKGKTLALLLLACLLLSAVSCGKGPLEKSRAWLQKGELDKARAALEDSLAKQPDWHEGLQYTSRETPGSVRPQDGKGAD